MKKIRIHCSSLPRIIKCPASIIAPKKRLDLTTDAARMGTAIHAYLSEYISSGAEKPRNCSSFLEREISSPTEEQYKNMELQCKNGEQIWKELSRPLDLNTLQTESYYELDRENFVLSGFADLWGVWADNRNRLFILDWKTTNREVDARSQMTGYAALIANGNQTYSEATLVTAYTRLQTWTQEEIYRGDIENMLIRLEDIAAGHIRNYGPSDDTCVFCPRAHECPCLHDSSQ